MVISGYKTRSVFGRYNITNSDLVDAGKKIREGRERIEHHAKDFAWRAWDAKYGSGTRPGARTVEVTLLSG